MSTFTRGALTHQYYPAPVATIRTAGAIRVSARLNNSNPWMRGVPMVWPIMRPSTAPNPNGAPFYLTGYAFPGQIIRGGGGGGGGSTLRMNPPRREMDPSDPNTWQREYRFT
jgi:hypothetical protein